MSDGYTKLWSSIIHSTVWREEAHVKVVWITLLAMADREGLVMASIPGLADAARVSIEQAEEALCRLSSPDRYSRTRDHEGRRIEEADGGWILLNHAKYRNLRSAEERRIQVRDAVRRHRAKVKGEAEPVIECNPGKPGKAQAEAEAEAEAERDTVSPTSPTGPGGPWCSCRPSVGYPDPYGCNRFAEVQARYPKRLAKSAAWRAWRFQARNLGAGCEELHRVVMGALDWQEALDEWTRDDGQFVPYLGTYLNGRRWEDEPPPPPPARELTADEVGDAARREYFRIQNDVHEVQGHAGRFVTCDLTECRTARVALVRASPGFLVALHENHAGPRASCQEEECLAARRVLEAQEEEPCT